MSSPGAVERLEFTLPEFTRCSWVGDGARRAWEPRLERIRRAWLDVEWLSVVDGVRPCALVGVPESVLPAVIPRWTAHRLSAFALPLPATDPRPGLVLAAIGATDDVNAIREAWTARDDDALGRFLGYPDCCRAFFQDVWLRQRATDTTWGMATNTAAADGGEVTIDASDAPLANILWRWLGVRAVPHLPCRFDCGETARFAERLLAVATRAGFAEEVEWIREILSWPVEWSALHGIAEIKTPILKVSTRTDATAGKYVVRVRGTRYPREGATGLHFPFQAPTRPLLTESRVFRLGLKRPVEAPPPDPDWHHRDNGFSSLEAMHALHRPVVALARSALHGVAGRVLDLGCGNGALLASICDGRPELIPHGVDGNRAALANAQVLLPGLADHFVTADLFDHDVWNGRRYALTLLMPGRLLEVERPRAERLFQAVLASSDAVLLYSYPGSRPLAEMAAELGIALVEPIGETSALVERRAIDWARLAEPQPDQYDTEIIAHLAATTTSAERPQPHRRTPVGDAPSIFDGQVAVRSVYRSLPEFESIAGHHPDAPPDHPNIRAAAELIRCWPAAFRQCQRLLDSLHPALDDRVPLESEEVYRGSSCHSYERLFGTLWATIFCPIGLAEAIVHELAHQKLRVLGVSFESATRIVGNDPARRYDSPIVKERTRPMTAVLHAQYSYVHVTALDVQMLTTERDPARREVLGRVLERNLSRIEEGRRTLQAHFEPGEHGQAFMDGLERWTERTIAAARRLLGRPDETTAAAALPAIEVGARIITTPDRDVEVRCRLAAPQIVLLSNVLSDEECDALVEYCRPRMQRSPVVGDSQGNVKVHENRTSCGAMLACGETPLIARIEARLAALARWPVERSEGLNVLRYDIGQEYRPHFDSFDAEVPGLRQHLDAGGQRLGTFILYLSDVEAGGETSFPEIGFAAVPHKGSAIFFVNTDGRYAPDRRTLHAGLPVVTGVKYVANKWLRERRSRSTA